MGGLAQDKRETSAPLAFTHVIKLHGSAVALDWLSLVWIQKDSSLSLAVSTRKGKASEWHRKALTLLCGCRHRRFKGTAFDT